jgi:N-acetylglucosaminyldiphosphoundecaprenol N-acetyl-beta-D-mannosaminyltransferase
MMPKGQKLAHPLKIIRGRAGMTRETNYHSGLITFLNPYSYLYFRKHAALFNRFDRIYFDGILLVTAMRLIGIRSQRKSFDMTSLAPEVFNYCLEEGKSIYFIGSDAASIKAFGEVLLTGFPNLSVVGLSNGYFSSTEERRATINKINELNPDCLVVGMGTPLQEKFLVEVKEMGWQGIGFTCGGFIHQTAKGLDYYPKWMDKLHLRWLYRIWDEPKLLSRYLIQYPKFIGLFIYDLFTFGKYDK